MINYFLRKVLVLSQYLLLFVFKLINRKLRMILDIKVKLNNLKFKEMCEDIISDNFFRVDRLKQEVQKTIFLIENLK